ncbi:MAG TPA: host attachment protein [Pseudorhodoplanes sp.]|nr:host attachment protein [Pseudorhodoplanes sp.]
MTKVKIRQGDWVVACDGRKALILQNAGDEMFPNLQTKEVYEQSNPITSAQGSDAPGRAFGSVGRARSAVEQTDWHDEQEKAFLVDLAGRLDAAVGAGEARRIVMIAPPRALGILRPAYSPQLRQAIALEIDKDFVRLPVYEIEKHLAA